MRAIVLATIAVVASCAADGPQPATEADVWGYQDRLVSCVQTATTLEQSEACRARERIDFCRRFTPCPEP